MTSLKHMLLLLHHPHTPFLLLLLDSSSISLKKKPKKAMKEDWNTLASDCIVISCCCQCLILQIFIFILLKLPYKLVKKTTKYAKKKLSRRKRRKRGIERRMDRHREEFLFEIYGGGSMRVEEEGLERNECHGCGCCLEEVEKVIEELSQKGEFAFGSFWRKEEPGRLPISVAKQGFDSNVAQYDFVEMAS